ncbi:MAG: type IV pilin protein [Cellvibrionaceae bacterium]
MRRSTGFTLVELMIVVAIIAILAAVVYPSYQNNIEKGRRSDAQGALQGLAQAMERFYTNNSTYVGAGSAGGGGNTTGAPTIFSDKSPIDGSQRYYNLIIHAADGNSYVLAAEPVGGQADNGVLVLKSTGQRGWDRDNDSGGVASGLGASPNEVEATEWCWEVSCS